MQIFRLSKGWRIVSYGFCVLFVCLSIGALYLGTSGTRTFFETGGFFGVAVIFFLLTWYIFRDTRHGKLEITENHVTLVSPLRSVTLQLNEVRGFRFTDNYIIIEPNQLNRKKIRISTYLERQHELNEWFYEHFPNLDEVETEYEVKEILNNDDLGLFHESRIKKWQQARQVARWTNRVSWGVVVWMIFYPKPYLAATVTAMLLPIFAIGLAYYYRGLMKGGDRETSAYPSVAEAFAVPAMALILRALMDFDILRYTNAWAPILTLTVLLFFVYHFPTGGFSPGKMRDYTFLIVFPLITFAYSSGTILILNCAFDKSKSIIFETRVISKHLSEGRTTTYYLTVEPWKGLEAPEDIEVSSIDYERASVADRVTIYQFQGLLDIPWIEASLESAVQPQSEGP